MILTYGQDKEFEPTSNFINGLDFLARSYLAMMRVADPGHIRRLAEAYLNKR